jgi:hypothetical protein
MSTSQTPAPKVKAGKFDIHPYLYMLLSAVMIALGPILTTMSYDQAVSSGSGVYTAFYGITIAGAVLALCNIYGAFHGRAARQALKARRQQAGH